MDENVAPPRVRALKWSDPAPPDAIVSHYDHVVADSPIGQWMITWKSWKDYPGFSVELAGEYLLTANSLDDAKAQAQKVYEERILSALAAPAAPAPPLE